MFVVQEMTVFNKRSWVVSTGNRNALALSMLFGSISRTEYVPVLAYKIKDIVAELNKNGTPISDSTVRRTIKELVRSGHLFALRNTTFSGRQKIYIATFPTQERTEAFDVAIDAMNRFPRDFGRVQSVVLTGRNVHFDRLKRSFCTIEDVPSIIDKKKIRNLVGKTTAEAIPVSASNDEKEPTGKGVQLTLISYEPRSSQESDFKGKRVDKRSQSAAMDSKSNIDTRNEETRKVLEELGSHRNREILEAWSIYYDSTAAGELKNKIARMRLKFPLCQITKMLISDGWTYHEIEPSAVEKTEHLERWQERAAGIRSAMVAIEGQKRQQSTKWNEYTDNAKKELYRVQSSVIDAEYELEGLTEKLSRMKTSTFMSDTNDKREEEELRHWKEKGDIAKGGHLDVEIVEEEAVQEGAGFIHLGIENGKPVEMNIADELAKLRSGLF